MTNTNQVVTSLSALGIALAPALMKFAGAPRDADLTPADDAEVACVVEAGAPVHSRYQSTGTVARLSEGSLVQVLSRRKNWRHVAYADDGSAALGWVTEQYLEPCADDDGASNDTSDVEGDDHSSAGHGTGADHGQPRPLTGDEADFERSPNLALGLPTDSDPSDDFLIDHGIYVLSYNKARGDSNWVAWKLSAADLGDEDRQNDFRPDDALPVGFLKVTTDDYASTGFDRGHMCPSAHRTSDAEKNSLTFLMTNMQPQLHSLNAGPWKSLETLERKLADEQNKDIYVVAGGLFGSHPKTIGHNVAVPKANFRVTVVVDAGTGVSKVTDGTKVIAVEMPNDPSISGHKWTDFVKSVDEVEADTGYDFLSALPDNVEDALESAPTKGP
jgi:endonuclease G